jgi:hypothetical protein
MEQDGVLVGQRNGPRGLGATAVLQSFGLKLAQAKLLSLPLLNKIYGSGNFWRRRKWPQQISFQHFQTQNLRGPGIMGDEITKFLGHKTLPYTKST